MSLHVHLRGHGRTRDANSQSALEALWKKMAPDVAVIPFVVAAQEQGIKREDADRFWHEKALRSRDAQAFTSYSTWKTAMKALADKYDTKVTYERSGDVEFARLKGEGTAAGEWNLATAKGRIGTNDALPSELQRLVEQHVKAKKDEDAMVRALEERNVPTDRLRAAMNLFFRLGGKAPKDLTEDASGEYGVRYRQAAKSGAVQTREKFFPTQAALDAFVKKVENEDGFIEFVSWLSPSTRDATVAQRTSVGGHELKKPSAAVEAKYKELGGQVVQVTDKSVTLRFPDQASADEFKRFATRTDRAMFDRQTVDASFTTQEKWEMAVKAKYPEAKIEVGGRGSYATAKVNGEKVGLWDQYKKIGTVDAGRLVHTEQNGAATVKVYWDAANKEYTCKLYVADAYQSSADYFTDELEDAKNTAKDMARRAGSQVSRWRKTGDGDSIEYYLNAVKQGTMEINEANRQIERAGLQKNGAPAYLVRRSGKREDVVVVTVPSRDAKAIVVGDVKVVIMKDATHQEAEIQGMRLRYQELRAKSHVTESEVAEMRRLKQELARLGTTVSATDAVQYTFSQAHTAMGRMDVPLMKKIKAQFEESFQKAPAHERGKLREWIDMLTEQIQSA